VRGRETSIWGGREVQVEARAGGRRDKRESMKVMLGGRMVKGGIGLLVLDGKMNVSWSLLLFF